MAKKIDTIVREQQLLSQLMMNPEMFQKAVSFIKRGYFDSPTHQIMFDLMEDFYEKYKTIPTTSTIVHDPRLNTEDYEIESDYLTADEPWDGQYLFDRLISFTKDKAMFQAITESYEIYSSQNFDEYPKIEGIVQHALNMDLETDDGITIGEHGNMTSILGMLDDEEQTTPIGWENLDMSLDGGTTIPSLNYILAKTGGGKSVAMVNLARNYIMQGRDVLYVSLELKEAKIIRRYLSHMCNIPSRELKDSGHKIKNHAKMWKDLGYGDFTVKFYNPGSLNSKQLEILVRKYVNKTGRVPWVLVDYAGLMQPNTSKYDGAFEKDKMISEELRAIATSFNLVMWTAEQLGRCLDEDTVLRKPCGNSVLIKDVEIGEEIITLDKEGYPQTVMVLAKTEPEVQECFEIELDNGEKIICSEHHLFPVLKNGKQVMESLSSGMAVGDKLITHHLE